MMRPLRLLTAGAVLVFVFGACSGALAPTTELGAPITSMPLTGARGGPTPTPPTQPPLPDPEIDIDLSRVGVNDNDPSTPMGAVCWAVRELALLEHAIHMAALPNVAVSSLPPIKPTESDLGVLLPKLEAMLEPLDEASFGRPTREFVDHFIAQLGAARVGNQGRDLTRGEAIVEITKEYFDYGEYPGVQGFAKAAEASPSCRGWGG